MKKSLVALATLAATGAVMAQATIYGVTDIGYGIKSFSNANGATTAKQQGVMDGALAGNRIGFRGTEDLGGGMSANFVTEQGISPTNGALFGVRTSTAGIQFDGLTTGSAQFDQNTGGAYSQGTNRQTYVGLKGGFGEVRAGYQYTPVYEVSSLSGFTNTSEGVIGGQVAHTWGQGAVGGTRANAITYISPRMSGFQAMIQLGSAAGREQTEFLSANSANGTTLDKQARTALHIDYTAGPLRTALAYTQFNSQVSNRAAGSSSNFTTNSANLSSAIVITTFNVYGALTGVGAAGTTGDTTYSANLLQLAGSYDFGSVKIGATLNSGKQDITSGIATPIVGSAPSLSAHNAVGSRTFASRALSAEIPLGASRIWVGMNSSTLEGSLANVSSAPIADISGRQIGYLYDFSKRTTAYGFIGSTSDALAATTTVKDQSQTIMGIRHSF
jgi:predicted porin